MLSQKRQDDRVEKQSVFLPCFSISHTSLTLLVGIRLHVHISMHVKIHVEKEVMNEKL
jgi:hypothetical protein